MIPPDLPSAADLAPELEKLKGAPGSCITIVIEHAEPVCNSRKSAWRG
jgi:hypothetical protein